MPGIFRRIQPGPVYQLLYDAHHVDTGQPACLQNAHAD
jgi:hypothetical protein